MALLQLKGLLELYLKRREFLPGSGFLHRRAVNLAVESDVILTSFRLPCFWTAAGLTGSRNTSRVG